MNQTLKPETMQADLLNKMPQAETKNHLRVATITNEKSALFFLYIGKNEDSIKFLLNTTISGVIAENFENAKKLIQSENFSEQTVDVIIVDVSYNPVEFASFCTFLQTGEKAYRNIPVVYNESQLINQNISSCADVIDDIIDLPNWQFDLASKFSFLKRAKEYQHVS